MRKYLLFFYIIVLNTTLWANNVQVSNVEVIRIDRTNQIIYIKFDISGENAWRINTGAQNWDANWIFVKYRSGTGDWSHATLSTNPSNYVYPTEVTVDPANDGKGVFIYLSDANAGLISSYNYQNIVLAWNYGADGFNENTTDLEVKVFAIEMVYVPTGDFYLGDGVSSGTFHDTAGNPALISQTGIVLLCNNTNYDDAQLENDGVYIDGDDGIDTNGDLIIDNPDYPTGYKAFYCMKYEVSQQQYVDFLNTLTATEANDCFTRVDSSRNFIDSPSVHPNITTPAPYLAMNWIDWYDLLAYLDWAALRPMTELEYEKVARGTATPIAGEYPWGTTSVANSTYTLSNADRVDETVINPSTSAGNANWVSTVPDGDLKGPMRCGILAVNNTSNSREFSGASYYGIMDLAGNLWEMIVTIGNADGRNFAGTNGDGFLVNSRADNADWPHDGTGSNLGTGFKGSSYRDGRANFMRISNREYAAYGYFVRDDNQGGRGVRTVN